MSNPPTVLIVDDHPKNVKLLEAHLVSTGVNTIAAFNGEEALEKIEAFPPDLILLDVMMPKIDGFEVCRRVKNNEKTRLIPIVMITALDQIEDKVKGINAGADDFLTKPVNRLELLARTKALIKTKNLNDQVLNLQETLAALFEITTFRKRFSDRKVLLAEFSRRAAELTQADSVAITFWRDGEINIEAQFNLPPDAWTNGTPKAVSQVMESGEMLVIRSNQTDKLKHYSLNSGFIGVALKSFKGEPLGAINALGIPGDLQDSAVHFLTIIAQRLGYEIELKDYNKRLEHEVDLRTSELQKALFELKDVNENLKNAQAETIFRLAKAGEYRDEDTASHLFRMSNYTYCITKELKYDEPFCELIKVSSTMHDVGKIGVPDAILLKKGRFTPEEYNIMKEHTLIGAKILAGSSSETMKMSEKIALCHHEKYNGTGYPYQLSKEEIPIEGRIVAVADVFDALTTERVYKAAFPIDDALDYMKKESGEHFDPDVFAAFMAVSDEIISIKKHFSDQATPFG